MDHQLRRRGHEDRSGREKGSGYEEGQDAFHLLVTIGVELNDIFNVRPLQIGQVNATGFGNGVGFGIGQGDVAETEFHGVAVIVKEQVVISRHGGPGVLRLAVDGNGLKFAEPRRDEFSAVP